MSGAPDVQSGGGDSAAPTEANYTDAAQLALERGDLRLALEQIAGALSYRPNAPELRALLDVALGRSKQPLTLLPHTGEAFFGVGAVRAAALARAGKLGEAIVQLFDVVSFRPSAPYLVWIEDWRTRGLRGVGVDAVAAAAARFHNAIDREVNVAPENLAALARLLAALRAERPKARETLLRLEVITLRLFGDVERAELLVDEALTQGESASLLLERGLNQRARCDFEGAVASLRRAHALAPKDRNIAADLADACVRAGLLEEAAHGYEALRGSEKDAHAIRAGLCLDALAHPTDATLRAEALAATADPRALPELALTLRVARTTMPPWDDVLAHAIVDMVEDLRRRPPPERAMRVRLQLDRPLPASARALFRAAASDLGIVADLCTNEAPSSLPETPHATAETRALVAALTAQPLDLDRWAEPGPTLVLDEASCAFAAPLDGMPRTVEGFERQRLAVLSLALRSSEEPTSAAFAWALELASAEDAWAARAALLVLGAAARRSRALDAAVVAASSEAFRQDDARVVAAAAIRIHFSDQVLREGREEAVALVVAAASRARVDASDHSSPHTDA